MRWPLFFMAALILTLSRCQSSRMDTYSRDNTADGGGGGMGGGMGGGGSAGSSGSSGGSRY